MAACIAPFAHAEWDDFIQLHKDAYDRSYREVQEEVKRAKKADSSCSQKIRESLGPTDLNVKSIAVQLGAIGDNSCLIMTN
jgi:hypothetical protein